MAGVEFVKYTPGKMVKVKITSPTRVRGQHFPEGAVVQLSDEDAQLLFGAQKAVRHVEPVAPAKEK